MCGCNVLGGSDQHNTAYRLGLWLMHIMAVGQVGTYVGMQPERQRHDSLSTFVKERIWCKEKIGTYI